MDRAGRVWSGGVEGTPQRCDSHLKAVEQMLRGGAGQCVGTEIFLSFPSSPPQSEQSRGVSGFQRGVGSGDGGVDCSQSVAPPADLNGTANSHQPITAGDTTAETETE